MNKTVTSIFLVRGGKVIHKFNNFFYIFMNVMFSDKIGKLEYKE